MVVVQLLSHARFLQPMDRLLCPWDSLGKNTGVGYHFLLQVIFPTPELTQGLLHCRQILYRQPQQLFINLLPFMAELHAILSRKGRTCIPSAQQVNQIDKPGASKMENYVLTREKKKEKKMKFYLSLVSAVNSW